MNTNPRPLVLCVDDEPHVLAGLSLHLGRSHRVLTATSGPGGLAILAKHADIAVVVSDMRMPGMDGATFLRTAREASPNAVRLLLTGQSDVESAIAAVNEGQVFRFLTKPCPPNKLLASVQSAADQHRLITAERVLLEQTLHGTIRALTDVLALANPAAFGRAGRLKKLAGELAGRLGVAERWQVEVAAMLSQIGYLALPVETVEKVYLGQPLSSIETQLVARVPAVTAQLVGNIPRLEPVREILTTYTQPYADTKTESTASSAQRLAQILRVTIDFDAWEGQSRSKSLALDRLTRHAGAYDPQVVGALQAMLGEVGTVDVIRDVRLLELEAGMTFLEDVVTDAGVLFAARGLEVTEGMVERMHNMRQGSVKEPIRISHRKESRIPA